MYCEILVLSETYPVLAKNWYCHIITYIFFLYSIISSAWRIMLNVNFGLATDGRTIILLITPLRCPNNFRFSPMESRPLGHFQS